MSATDARDELAGVRVATGRGLVTLSWFARIELLEYVRRLEGGAEVVRRFNESVDTEEPVMLEPEDRRLVLDLLQRWLDEVGVDGVPAGIVALREALIADLDGGELETTG